VILVAQYLQLAIGILGTVLAELTALSTAINPSRLLELPLSISILFVVAALSGFAQWIAFQRRHFDAAVLLFGVTIVSWSAAAVVHVAHTMPDCSKGCVLVLTVPPK
jgi:hypothetical protein